MKDYVHRTAKFYDEFGDEFSQRTNDLQPTLFLKKITSELVVGDRILDVGCAAGRDLATFDSLGFEIYGVDISKSMTERAMQHVPTAKVFVMSVLDLAFENDFFDAVWASAILVHIARADIRLALSEIVRVLKTDGMFYTSFKFGSGEGFSPDSRYGGVEKFYAYYGVDELRNLFDEAGLKIELFDEIKFNDAYRKSNQVRIIARKK